MNGKRAQRHLSGGQAFVRLAVTPRAPIPATRVALNNIQVDGWFPYICEFETRPRYTTAGPGGGLELVPLPVATEMIVTSVVPAKDTSASPGTPGGKSGWTGNTQKMVRLKAETRPPS